MTDQDMSWTHEGLVSQPHGWLFTEINKSTTSVFKTSWVSHWTWVQRRFYTAGIIRIANWNFEAGPNRRGPPRTTQRAPHTTTAKPTTAQKPHPTPCLPTPQTPSTETWNPTSAHRNGTASRHEVSWPRGARWSLRSSLQLKTYNGKLWN